MILPPGSRWKKRARDDFEQGNVKNFADEEAYIDYCRHNYELSSRPSSIEKLNDDLTARETVLTFDPSLLGSGYFAYCDENALYAKEYSDANNSRHPPAGPDHRRMEHPPTESG